MEFTKNADECPDALYVEPAVPHHRPHFHAYYQNQVAVYSIDPIGILSGALPRRQQRLVEAWVEFIKENS